MKRTIKAIFGLALLTALSASAQTLTTNLFKVPFAFMAGKKILPAGEYRAQIDSNLSTKVVTLFNRAGVVASMISLDDGDGNGLDGLQFGQYGDTKVLDKVWIHGLALRMFPPSKSVQRQLAKLNRPNGQPVIASNAPAR